MVEIDERVLLNMQSMIQELQEQVAILQDFQNQHVGFDVGMSGVGYVHPNQKVSTIEFAEGTMRLNLSGIDLNGNNLNNVVSALRITNGLFQPVLLPKKGFPPLGTYGLSLEGYVRQADNIYWVFGSTDELSAGLNNISAGAQAFSTIESNITTNRVDISVQALDKRNASGRLQAYVKVESVNVPPSYNAVWVTHAPLVLDWVTADYAYIATVGNGALWHRGDLNKLRAYIAGIVENLAIESWVTANFAPIAPTYAHELMLMGA